MKKLFTSILLVAFACGSFGQTEDLPFSVGFHLGTFQYEGDLGNEYFKFNNLHWAPGFSGAYYLSPSFDVMGTFTYGIIDHSGTYGEINRRGIFKRKHRYFRTDIWDFNFLAKYKFNNGHILDTDFFLQPYIIAGFGDAVSNASHYRETRYQDPNDPTSIYETSATRMDFNFPVGIGVSIPFHEQWSANIMSIHNYTMSDKYDDIRAGKFNDQFLWHSVGVVYAFNFNKDTDGDGIVDKDDACPEKAGPIALMGCPDKDKDGIADKDDQCPNAAGKADMGGCPDKDGDKIADKDDDCPDVAGLTDFKGCPDTDGDGIKDGDDDCPKIAGLEEFKGCPDTDGDGLADKDDECPKEPGKVELNGCPDNDGDGIANKNDKCPDVAGIPANKGCPEVKEEVKKVMSQAMEGLFFNSGSDVIQKRSYRVLDAIVKVLEENPEYRLLIEGHTDSSGDEAKNLDLSKRRAAAAQKYLVDKGIDFSRLSSEGYGITKPVADNGTAAGRAKNRRVEFTIKF